jgi:hypothetical protein
MSFNEEVVKARQEGLRDRWCASAFRTYKYWQKFAFTFNLSRYTYSSVVSCRNTRHAKSCHDSLLKGLSLFGISHESKNYIAQGTYCKARARSTTLSCAHSSAV